MSQEASLQELTRAAKNRILVLEEQIPQLQRERGDLDARIADLDSQLTQLRALIGGSPVSEPPSNVLQLRVSSSDLADRVVGMLREMRRPMHYREIEAALRKRGQYAGGGQDPANALLATYFNDPRLRRVSRGTYAPRTTPSDGSDERRASEPRYLNRKIRGFSLNGNHQEVSTFKDLLMSVIRYCEAKHPVDFERVLTLRGTKRPYFSRDPQDLRSPAFIGRSGIYVEANLSADDIVKRCREVLEVSGEDPRSLKIDSSAA